MHKSGVEAMSPPLDDIRPSPPNGFAATSIGPLERYISIFGGTALLIGGMRRGRLSMIMGGGVLLYRGATGFCPIYGALDGHPKQETRFEESITVHKPVEDVYRIWRHIEDLPHFMSHLKSVTSTNDRQSHWIANVPLPFGLEWDAEIIDDQENRKISWRSIPGSSVHHTGSVLFHRVPVRTGTEI